MNVSCHVLMCHISYECAESCHVWTSHIMTHVTYEWLSYVTYELFTPLLSRARRSCPIMSISRMNASRHTYERVMSHIWMRHVTLLRYLWCAGHVWSWSCHIWLCHLSRMNVSCHAYKWVMSHMNLSRTCAIGLVRVVPDNESCNIWICHLSPMNGSCHAYE